MPSDSLLILTEVLDKKGVNIVVGNTGAFPTLISEDVSCDKKTKNRLICSA